MTARRQASTTSLSKFARTSSPVLQNRSLDFCNAFWGIGDGGVDVLFARMRGATRTVEELRNFWNQRAALEEDYAKRLAKLSKVALGRDEIGDLRISMDTVKTETERQASFHQNLAQQIRTELEAQTGTFHARQLQFKKTHQTSIEKDFKTKQAQEAHVNKAREKYEADCMRINAYTAQSSLVQGKDLDKMKLKLERAHQTVQVNEKEFANLAKILQDTTQKWEQNWKTFCDNCQDLEEQRMEFLKDNMWAYANCVSTVCVSDDESCEKIRLSLEQMEPEREMENFVRDYGTGNEIPDPPPFVNYNAPDSIPSSSSRPTTKPANFLRSSTRELLPRAEMEPADDEPPINTAGVGAGGGGRRSEIPPDAPNLHRQDTQHRNSVSNINGSAQPYQNGNQNGISPFNQHNLSSAPPTIAPNPLQRRPTSTAQAPSHRVAPDPLAEPLDPNAETYIKVGNNAYKVDLSKDPQQQSTMSLTSRSTTSSPIKQNGTIDPLEKQLQELQNVVSTTGSTRRNTLHKPPPANILAQRAASSPSAVSPSTATRPLSNIPKSLSPPAAMPAQANRSPSPSRDYRNSAEMVVGTHPSISSSRPASPNPPTAAFMVPRASPQPTGAEVINEVLADYQQSLPGERKSISRTNSKSRRTSFQPQGHTPNQSQASITIANQNNNTSQGQNLQRPLSSVGHAGIGAHGGSRSNSPQPQSRGPSPAPNAARVSLISPPTQPVARAPSPNSIGIALDPNGRVLHDEMAQGYQQHQQALQQRQPPQQRPPQQPQPLYNPPMAPPVQQQAQRRTSYIAAAPSAMAPPPPPQMYSITPPPPAPVYQPPPPAPQPIYPAAPMTHPTYTPPSQLLYQQQQQPQAATQPVQPIQQQPGQAYQQPQQLPVGNYGVNINGPQRATSVSNGYYTAPPQQQQPPQQYAVQRQPPQAAAAPGYQQWNRGTSPAAVRRSPSPQPPQQTMEDGSTVLFYVKALYDYVATIDEEFDFQAGDIIAVTSTPEDGWWTGELLDEARRQRGRNVFPSNFVCLF